MMNTKTLSALLLASTTSLLAVACGGGADAAADDASEEDGVTVSEAISARVAPGTFKLYAEPNATPNPNCDLHTQLDLKAGYFSTARFEEVVGGFCEIAVIPNIRTYRLRLAGTDCGTRIYTGSRTRNGVRTEIKITDNRTRLCENVVAASVIVDETRDGHTFTKYSYDRGPTEQVTVTGTLKRSFGIGGENTGTSIEENGHLTELVLDDGERNQFEDGKKARVKGTVTSLSGVETNNRRAIDVSEMLVCPTAGTINCMPMVNGRLSSLCGGENRSWVQANCSGVDYVD